MKSLRLIPLSLLLLLCLALLMLPAPARAEAPTPEVEPALQRALSAADDDAPARVIAILRTGHAPTSPTTLVAQRQRALTQARAPLDALLDAGRANGDLLAAHDLWLIGGIALTARPAFIDALRTSPAVRELRLDHYRSYLDAPPAPDEARAPDPLRYSLTASAVTSPTWGVTAIRAPEVWATLNVSGTGAVVAVMDTGVDWLHPALQATYRGQRAPLPPNHSASWFDAVNAGQYPYDDHGHGTHVAGTAAGRELIGVAPDARWIGVKMLNNKGEGYDSWIHAGFQWLLAPGGDPALAPDVVNASWGATQSRRDVFAEDIAALHAAGILTVFAAGNRGPRAGSVGSPASNPGVFAVGAHDPDSDVAFFSGRGPSPWGEIKPYAVAPGVNVLSAQPGGVYGNLNGTSMATPHVAGVAALMRSAAPDLSVADLTRILTTTAVPLTTTIPNHDSGWGRVDALHAVAVAGNFGMISGTVRRAGGHIPHATIRATAQIPPQSAGQMQADAQGAYALPLAENYYDVTVSAFGYLSQDLWGVEVLQGQTTPLDVALQPLPTGKLQGRVTVAPGNVAPAHPVKLSLVGTPLTTMTDAQGYYALTVPRGVYTVEARALGYRVTRATVLISRGEMWEQPLELTPAPTLLLVDEGAWYYASQIAYWRASLDALDYAYDLHTIKDTSADAPLSATLALYDIVLWSSPRGAPGLVTGAAGALRDYLEQGGRLWISGQDVAYYDGGGYPSYFPQHYLVHQISARFVADNAASRAVSGHGPFAGLSFDIAGGDGADNQREPDVVLVRDPDLAAPLWRYHDGTCAGISAEVCVPYRALYFAFGFEAIAETAARHTVMERAIDWLMQPPPATGATFQQAPPLLIGMPGDVLTHTLFLRNVAYAGEREQFTLSASASDWPARVAPATAAISPCEWLTITVQVTIPENTPRNTPATTVLWARGQRSAPISITLHTKTPAPVLLVDDDRWYPMEGYYQRALEARAIPYDIWDTEHNLGGPVIDKSPTLEVLQRYPVVVWFTGYDWYAPLLDYEITRLEQYLDGGGRLMLVSQEYLYRHYQRPFTRRLGVLTASGALPATALSGVADHPAGGFWPPAELVYPYPNRSVLIEPRADAAPVLRGEQGQPMGLAAGELQAGQGRTLFYAVELAALPAARHADVLARGVGWLSALGQSQWTVTPATPLPGERVTATLTLHNDAAITVTAAFSHALPALLDLVPETVPEAVTYHAGERALTWQGTVAPDDPLTFTWAATLAPTQTVLMPVPLTPTVTLALPEIDLAFARESRLLMSGGRLEVTRWIDVPPRVQINRPVTFGLELHNTGHAEVPAGHARFWLTSGWESPESDERFSHGWSARVPHAALAPGESTVVTTTLSAWRFEAQRVDALWSSETTFHDEMRHWVTIDPWRVYLPQVLRTP